MLTWQEDYKIATLDGYNPYPTGLTAAQCVAALKRAYLLDVTLQDYAFVAKTETPPPYEDVDTTGEFWFCTKTQKLYRAYRDEDEKIVLWFEV